MGYLQQRALIDSLMTKLPEERRKFYAEKLAKIDKRDGGSHRVGITGILSMLQKEVN